MEDFVFELHIGDSEESIGYVNSDFVYDKRTGNYHLIPKERDEAIKMSTDIYKKLSDIRKYMICNDFKNKLNKKCKMIRLVVPRDTYFKKENSDYRYAKDIFAYIRVFVGNTRFDLTGIRFYKESCRVCCSLKNIQFIKLKVSELLSCTAYPDKFGDGESKTSTIEESIEYFNPNVKFGDKEEVIVNKFVEFINKSLQD